MKGESIEQRFWSKVDKKTDEKCWEWLGTFSGGGYGRFRMGNDVAYAHRISWILKNGEFDRGESYHGICVLHKCDNRKCVNPNHLFLGTQKENIVDMFQKGRKIMKYGSEHPRPAAKLSESQVKIIRSMYSTRKYTQQKLSEIWKVTQDNISRLVNK